MGLIFLATIAIFASAEECPTLKANELTSEKVYSLTQIPSCNIKSVYDLIARLPESFRSDYALFYRSRSIQGPMRTDYKRPRVILAGSDRDYGRSGQPVDRKKVFMLSFNSGSPDQPGGDSVEMVDIDTSGGRDDVNVFKYRDITFKDGQAKLSEPNPTKCKSCHGDPARGIYPGYPDWEGSFGSLHIGPLPPEEVAGFNDYKAALKEDPGSRYNLLPPPGNFGSFSRPENGNNVINGELGQANAIRVGRLLLRTPEFNKFKFAIAAGLLRCSKIESFIPKKLAKGLHGELERRFAFSKTLGSVRQIDSTYEEMHKHKRYFLISDYIYKVSDKVNYSAKEIKSTIRSQLGTSLEMERLYLNTFKVQGFSRADPLGANLRFLLEGRGLNIHNYFLDLMQPTYRFHNGGGAAEAAALELAKHDDDLRKLIDDSNSRSESKRFSDPKACAKLKIASLAALRDQDYKADSTTEAGICLTCQSSTDPSTKNLKDVAQSATSAAHAFNSNCAHCHDSEFAHAPYIPFSNPDKFRGWLKTGENAAKVRERLVHPIEEKRMPQDKRLTDEDIGALIKFISTER